MKEWCDKKYLKILNGNIMKCCKKEAKITGRNLKSIIDTKMRKKI